MKRRTFIRSVVATSSVAAVAGTGLAVQARAAGETPTGLKAAALDAMKRATLHMDEVVSYRGGYVWFYLPDLSFQLGEMQAYRTMAWMQPPGTPSVGHVYLDAYHATGDERYYKAAERTALAVRTAQRKEGGWNYIHDFAGESSLKQWYATIGANGWRLEELQHYYGNSTFDDGTTAVPAQLMLRMYLERKDKRFRKALDDVIKFVVAAQFPASAGAVAGGWPQRFPHSRLSVEQTPVPNPDQVPPGAKTGMEDGDYTSDATFNDGAIGQNLRFLTMCVLALGRTDLVPVIERGMECVRRLQLPGPQAGWSPQYLSAARPGRPVGSPAGARSYEPRALGTHTTDTNIRQLFDFVRLTGDRRYLERVPEAIAWLKTCPLPADAGTRNPALVGRTHPTYIELGSNDALWIHRYGSNINNGAYYIDKNLTNTVGHTITGRIIDIAALETEYAALMSLTAAQLADLKARSPLYARSARALPKYFSLRELDFPDLFEGTTVTSPVVTEAAVQTIVDTLGTKGYWTIPLSSTANRYAGPGPATPYTGTAYAGKFVGDIYDTSPYPPDAPPAEPPYVAVERPQAIVTGSWSRRMSQLISYVAPVT